MLSNLSFRHAVSCLLALLALGACSQPPVIPIDDQSFIPAKKTVHIAGSGDTLYSIAFLAGLDYRELAAWNNIDSPYLIRRGQKISLLRPETYTQGQKTQAITPSIQPVTRVEPVAKPAVTSEVVTLNPAPKQPAYSSPAQAFKPFDNSWNWPIAAISVVNYKPSSLNSGLDIISKRGVPVRASASGKVVYAGNGLKGYGNLIIIKHSEAYLSAYAHNESIAVKEGERVTQGQMIASVGSTDAKQAKLHFEIRKNGKPIDPRQLLPNKVG